MTGRVRRVCAVLLALALGGALFAPAPATAAKGHRCRTSRPACGIGAEQLCICPSRGSSDAKCRWECGVLG